MVTHRWYRIVMILAACTLFDHAVMAKGYAGEKAVRRVWNRRQHEVRTARYETTWIEITFDSKGNRRNKGAMDAAMAFDKRQFRFDIRQGQSPLVLILDAKGLHSGESATQGKPADSNEDASKVVKAQSPWILAYPLLISHGLVPIPPFSHDGIMRTRATKVAHRKYQGGPARHTKNCFNWRDAKDHWWVRVESDDELVRKYCVYEKNSEIVRIGITHKKLGQQAVVDRFSIVWFSKSGEPSCRVDAKVNAVQIDDDLETHLFVPPRTRDELSKTLSHKWDRSLSVKAEMSVEEVARLLQDVFADHLRVQVDQEAFHKPIEFAAKPLSFDSDTITVADLLLDKLQSHALDFRFDSQGITILPRHVAWKSAELTEYTAENYGMTVDELQSTLYQSARPDEWSDVGGPASIMVDKETDTVMVMHTQSEHIQLSRTLRQIVKETDQ